MDTLFAENDVADLDDEELEPVADEDWEQAAAAIVERAEPALDTAARLRAGEEDRDEDDEDEDERQAAATVDVEEEDEEEDEDPDAERDQDEADGACDHACRGNAARPGSCCLLNAVGPAAVDEAVACAAAQDQQIGMAAAAAVMVGQQLSDAAAAAPVVEAAVAPMVEAAVAPGFLAQDGQLAGGQELSAGN